MKIILAVDRDFGIGKDNKLLFHLKKDLAHFKKITLNNIVIMGRKTYDSMHGALPNRENIVITRNKNLKLKDALVFNDVDSLVKYLKENKKNKDVFVIGGNQIVDLLLDYCDEAIITKIDGEKKADTFLHNFDDDHSWKVYEKSDIFTEDGVSFEYVTYRRVK